MENKLKIKKKKKRWYGRKETASKKITQKDLELLVEQFNKKHHNE